MRAKHLIAAAVVSFCAIAGEARATDAFQAEQLVTTVLRPQLAATTQAILRRPPDNPKAHIGIYVLHAFGPSSNNPICTNLARKGYTTLCADSIYTGHQFDYKGYEDHAPAIAAAVNYLRNNVPGITKVVLFGHSMGGPMMAFYANVSENGAHACQAPERILPCDTRNLVDANGQSKLPKVDGLILSDTHPGDAVATFTYVDPAISDPSRPGMRNPAVDMFAAANGYPGDAQAAAPHFKDAQYSAAFAERFFAAQAARNAEILKQAQAMQAGAKSGDPRFYPDGGVLVVPGSEGAARLLQADLDLWKCTKRAHVFLTRDGRSEMSPGPICSVRPPSASFAGANSVESVIHVPVENWLGARAVRTNGTYRVTMNGIEGLDYDSSNTSTVTNVKGWTKPLLVISHGAHYFMAPDEIVFDTAKSTDKTMVVTEGAVHAGTPCGACEQMQGLARGYYGDTLARTHAFIDDWMAKRF
jgi:pimeloyl-ACP methyl ester carboxylesterase